MRIEPFGAVDTTVSYFLGNDPAQWRPDVPVWGGVRYVDLYPGVDLVLGGSDGAWRLEAAPAATTGQVRVQVDGASLVALHSAVMALEAGGQPLSIALPSAPFAYQVTGLGSQGDTLALVVRADWRPAGAPAPADDPGDLIYSTFLGGSSRDEGYAIAVDGEGRAYVTGYTRSSDFPTTPGAFDPTYNGDNDAFVAKLNAAGSALEYATFLGGSSNDYGYAIAVDGEGRAYVTGYTLSSDFPTTPGAFDPTYSGNRDAFVAKLNAAGSALEYATFLGGNGSAIGSAIAVDAEGHAHVTGSTGSSDFPTTPGAFDPTYNGGYWGDGFVAKLNAAGSAMDYATFLGGSSDDAGHAIAVDTEGCVYVTGYTRSSDFPTTPGAFDPTYNGGYWGDAFVAKLNAAGSALEYATFLGGSSRDQGYGIAVDGAGRAYVMGYTESSDFPTTPSAFDPTHNGNGDAFVAKLNAAGSALEYATFLGGSYDDLGSAIVVDGEGRAYVTGHTRSSDFPTTPGAFDPTYNGDAGDAFVAKLNAAGSALEYATFLGGGSYDYGYAIAVDGAGRAYVTGYGSSDFPTTPGAFDPTYNGGGDAFVAMLSTEPQPHSMRWLPIVLRHQ